MKQKQKKNTEKGCYPVKFKSQNPKSFEIPITISCLFVGPNKTLHGERIHVIPKKRDRYRLRVRASDRGEPPSYADVDVELDVVDRNNKPPIWDKSIYGPIHIRENVTVGTVVTSVKARHIFAMSKWLNLRSSYLKKTKKE
uniref:Cadherin domain-containing protein n=1 Tax=Glossina austeni TaxID=7395 RepID=A0A1A9UJP6_GLOAU